MNKRPVAEHIREHKSVLATAEKRLLTWLAERLPSWVTSDHLTLLGLTSMFMAGASYWAARWDERALILVVVALALNWFGDSLDGTLARVRNCQRPRYGFYVDHVIDIVGASFLWGGLAASGYMTPLVALGFLVAYLLVCAEIFLATYSLGVFRLSFGALGATELRILLSFGTLCLLYKPVVQLGNLGAFLLFDVGAVCGMVGLVFALAFSTARNTHTLYQAEPLR